jgi:uncharacterized protein (DUF736 family)
METNEKPKLEEAGAFWIKTSKTGNNFLTGTVKSKTGEEIKVIVFKNKYKTEGSNQPDYRVYFDTNPPVTKNSSPVLKPAVVEKAISSTDNGPVNKTSAKTEEIPF